MARLSYNQVADVILERLRQFTPGLSPVETGTVASVGDGVARVYGMTGAVAGELVHLADGMAGIVQSLDEDGAGVVILGHDSLVRAGDEVRRTGSVLDVPVGNALCGRVVDALGNPIDGGIHIQEDARKSIESDAPKIAERQPVREPLETGIKAIDMLVPIGRGQRQLILGDRETGKTSIAVDTIINQKHKDVRCVYVGIGQRMSALRSLANTLEEADAMKYTTIVAATAEDPPALQYIAPYTGCTIAEHTMLQGGHSLVVYDDLSRHAVAYRSISLLLRRPPGREAYPGDIFFVHARLLERAAKLTDERGGGSMTALPIVTTLAGDISAYIPTNVISITDGQIFLESELFFAGVRPAINVGLSVSRVGGAAQPPAVREVASRVRLDLAQYRELRAFSRFASELDRSTRTRLQRGERVTEILKQPRLRPVPMPLQMAIVHAAVHGYLDEMTPDDVGEYEAGLQAYLRSSHHALLAQIASSEWSPQIRSALSSAIASYSRRWAKDRHTIGDENDEQH